MDIDSDANQATGDPANFGADFVLQYLLGESNPVQVGWL